MKGTGNLNPHISVIVPSCDRPQALRRLLQCLSRQELAGGRSFEVVVALDGWDAALGEPEAFLGQPVGASPDVRFLPLERVGISAAKNAAVSVARGDVLLFVNDDVEPSPDFVWQHADAQASGHSIVLGYSPWVRHSDQTLFDEMIAHTGMIFFYGDLTHGESYDFRHAWNLNLSVARSLVGSLTGPFSQDLQPVYYDDVEFAHRLIGETDGVFYLASAVAAHRHRFTLGSYFRRESLLGVMAHSLHRVNGQCFESIFGMELDDLIRTANSAIELDKRDEVRALAFIQEVGGQPCAHPVSARLIRAMYAAHLPLKRRAFRLGLLARQAKPHCAWGDFAKLANGSLERDDVFCRVFDPAARCCTRQSSTTGPSSTAGRSIAPGGP